MKKIYLLLALVAVLAACSKSDELNPDAVLLGMGGDTWAQTELDRWLYNEFVKPYNMDIKYKWDPYEISLSKTFVPVEESKVKELMISVKKVWITPYEKQAGRGFLQKLAPKRYVLVGSPEYNTNGTLTGGFAEGGNKIAILSVNAFDSTDAASVRKVLAVVQHEFAHTLHQTVFYPTEFESFCRQSYTGEWNTTPDADYRNLGFVSKYSRANPNEDFAEMVEYILMNGRAAFDAYVAGTTAPGSTYLRSKETIIVNYFKSVWGIDFYETRPDAADGLVDLTQDAIKALSN